MTVLQPDFWAQERDDVLAIILPTIEETALTGVLHGVNRLEDVGIFVDHTAAQAEAAAWARQYTDALLQQLETTTENGVGEIVANWLETPGKTRQDLEERLLPILDGNVARAENVAVSEVTTAATQGEYTVYEQAGIPLPPQFTQNGITLRFGPKLHPRCRCWTRIVRLSSGEYVVVWVTERDGLVCERQYDTPFGVVNGCRDMHNRVISEGPYMGMKLSDAEQAARSSND